MFEKLLAITKSDIGIIGGLWKSKKLAITAIWAFACFSLLDSTTSAAVIVAALAAGSLVVASYVISQSIVEAIGSKNIETDTLTVTTTDVASSSGLSKISSDTSTKTTEKV